VRAACDMASSLSPRQRRTERAREGGADHITSERPSALSCEPAAIHMGEGGGAVGVVLSPVDGDVVVVGHCLEVAGHQVHRAVVAGAVISGEGQPLPCVNQSAHGRQSAAAAAERRHGGSHRAAAAAAAIIAAGWVGLDIMRGHDTEHGTGADRQILSECVRDGDRELAVPPWL
jgi:hypothetical protein